MSILYWLNFYENAILVHDLKKVGSVCPESQAVAGCYTFIHGV